MWLILFSSLLGAEIQIGQEILSVEIAATEKAREKGLMYRTSLAEGTGMLFIFPKPMRLRFWMKNTLIPLSIGFFNTDQLLLNVVDLNPPQGDNIPEGYSLGPAQYVLEVPQGWFQRKQIEPGMKFSFLDPSNSIK